MIVIEAPVSVDVRLAVLSFLKGAIVIYSVLFLTLERGWLKYNKPYWLT
jgi:hypothetical protein